MFYHLNCFKIQKASFNKRNKRQARSCVLLSRMNSKILGSSIRLINRPSPHLLPTVTEQRQKLQSIARCKNNHHKSSSLSSENNSSPVDNNANIHQKKNSAPAKITLARAPSTKQQLKKILTGILSGYFSLILAVSALLFSKSCSCLKRLLVIIFIRNYKPILLFGV